MNITGVAHRPASPQLPLAVAESVGIGQLVVGTGPLFVTTGSLGESDGATEVGDGGSGGMSVGSSEHPAAAAHTWSFCHE